MRCYYRTSARFCPRMRGFIQCCVESRSTNTASVVDKVAHMDAKLVMREEHFFVFFVVSSNIKIAKKNLSESGGKRKGEWGIRSPHWLSLTRYVPYTRGASERAPHAALTVNPSFPRRLHTTTAPPDLELRTFRAARAIVVQDLEASTASPRRAARSTDNSGTRRCYAAVLITRVVLVSLQQRISRHVRVLCQMTKRGRALTGIGTRPYIRPRNDLSIASLAYRHPNKVQVALAFPAC